MKSFPSCSHDFPAYWESHCASMVSAFHLNEVEIESGEAARCCTLSGVTPEGLRFWAAGYRCYQLLWPVLVAIPDPENKGQVVHAQPYFSVQWTFSVAATCDIYTVNWVTPGGHLVDDEVSRGLLAHLLDGFGRMELGHEQWVLSSPSLLVAPHVPWRDFTSHERLEAALQFKAHREMEGNCKPI